MSRVIELLREAGIDQPLREWRILQDHFQGESLEIALKRRLNREPMSQILGYRYFWKDKFIVTKDVLDPRPDSELFLELIGTSDDAIKILDLGSGSGALGLSALREYPNAFVTFADISHDALDIVRQNTRKLGLNTQVETIYSDWLSNLQGKFHLILCNPPYIRESEMLELAPELNYEPLIALTPGGDGLAPYINIAKSLANYLGEGGRAFFEHGHLQQEEVCAIFRKHGFLTRKHSDLTGKPRIVEVFLHHFVTKD